MNIIILAIDTSLKGAERKQIPMFATTVTKPYRFTDTTFQGKIRVIFLKM